MSRSKEITKYKRLVMSEILNSEDIIDAIAEPNITTDNADELINLCIFDYNRIPDIEETARTYITIQINVPRIEKGGIYRNVNVVMRVIVHNDLMNWSGFGNRMDYIAAELDDLFSDREDFGFGRMLITSNVEGSIDTKHLARTLVFNCVDTNINLCGG